MDNSSPAVPNVSVPLSGPGRLLYQARQDLRLAPEDVAQILHLSAKQILALEQDDYKNLPGPTYVRGYLRSYAQLLGLSAEKVLESYNRLTIPIDPIALPKSAPPPQVTSSDRLVKAATLGVTVIVLGLVFLWWRSEGSSPAQERPPSDVVSLAARPTSAEQTGKLEYPPAPSAANQVSVTSQPRTSFPVTEPGLSSASDASRSQNAGTPASPSPVVNAVPANGKMAVSDMILDLAPSKAPEPPSVTEPAQNDRAVIHAENATDIPPGALQSRLVLHAMQESWADIRDAHDNKLLYENVPAGRSVTIEGLAPFSVFLGNADGVQVVFNGRNFDISRYKRGQVARFTLGAEASVNN
ncbi:MAG: RodZ domain-containing protein [Sulfuricaulis sp.]